MSLPNTPPLPELGDRCRDRVSGFEGVVTGESRFLNGCRRLSLSPEIAPDGAFREDRFFDDVQLEVLVKRVIEPHPAVMLTSSAPRLAATGGPRPDIPRR